ncbi:MAG TPA: hypothetical protein IGS52_13680 [Oscillatoriaceae cyanobacterium M33_DOE_052]|uniref:DUF6816 domain-containing protein n=1 Tax=Planktothricoides sp. SpSt-374 TaxID=2282167 RepID=A0A7C3ZV00_9CYAN|nr:hypothetical protein [Oscillatoriaceae cyanobacterium M33_DOE_052]
MFLLPLLWCGDAVAGEISARLATFPRWEKLPVTAVSGNEDLIYPDWMGGFWDVTSTLVDMVAPFGDAIATPGFEANRRYLNQPLNFRVRFIEVERDYLTKNPNTFVRIIKSGENRPLAIVADRTYNSRNITWAYFSGGQSEEQKTTPRFEVKGDPKNPNRQIAYFGEPSQENRLISTVTGRATEMLGPDEFGSVEVSQQVFTRQSGIYLNEVETTTLYRLVGDKGRGKIEADQVTAIYLSPQDPDYFAAGGSPVAIYRYRLEMTPVEGVDGLGVNS